MPRPACLARPDVLVDGEAQFGFAPDRPVSAPGTKSAKIDTMREEDMRSVLHRVCSELDLRARARSAASVACGASLLMVSGCGSPTELPSQTDAASADDGGGAPDANRSDAGGIQPLYMAPAPDAGANLDSGPMPDYMVQPVDAGIIQPVDAGPVHAYGVVIPPTDAGAVPLYMAQPTTGG